MPLYTFTFEIDGQDEFSRDFDCPDDGLAIEHARIELANCITADQEACVSVGRKAAGENDPFWLGAWDYDPETNFAWTADRDAA